MDVDALLDLIEELLNYSRAGTFDEAPGEMDLCRRAEASVARYRSAASSSSSSSLGSSC